MPWLSVANYGLLWPDESGNDDQRTPYSALYSVMTILNWYCTDQLHFCFPYSEVPPLPTLAGVDPSIPWYSRVSSAIGIIPVLCEPHDLDPSMDVQRATS